jgi:hypothetical protein
MMFIFRPISCSVIDVTEAIIPIVLAFKAFQMARGNALLVIHQLRLLLSPRRPHRRAKRNGVDRPVPGKRVCVSCVAYRSIWFSAARLLVSPLPQRILLNQI